MGDAKPLVWLGAEIKTPPLSAEARIEAGTLLRKLQNGERLSLPHSRPMPQIAKECHELRVNDQTQNLENRLRDRIRCDRAPRGLLEEGGYDAPTCDRYL